MNDDPNRLGTSENLQLTEKNLNLGGGEIQDLRPSLFVPTRFQTFINYNVKLFIEDALYNWGNEPFELNSTVVAMPQPQKPLSTRYLKIFFNRIISIFQEFKILSIFSEFFCRNKRIPIVDRTDNVLYIVNMSTCTIHRYSLHGQRIPHGKRQVLNRIRDRSLHPTPELCSIYLLKHTCVFEIQSDPDLGTPRFRDTISFPRYRKVTLFDPDLISKPFMIFLALYYKLKMSVEVVRSAVSTRQTAPS
eukprot:sb/3468865/